MTNNHPNRNPTPNPANPSPPNNIDGIGTASAVGAVGTVGSKRENTSRFVILGLLQMRPMTGYDIKTTVERSIGFFWQESFGQIYPALEFLKQEGLIEDHLEDHVGMAKSVNYNTAQDTAQDIEKKHQENPENRENKKANKTSKYYRVTDAGQAALQRWLSEPIKKHVERNGLLLKIFLCGRKNIDVAQKHILASQQDAQERLQVLDVINQQLLEQQGKHPNYPLWRLAIREGQLGLTAHLQFCDEALRDLQELAVQESVNVNVDAQEQENMQEKTPKNTQDRP